MSSRKTPLKEKDHSYRITGIRRLGELCLHIHIFLTPENHVDAWYVFLYIYMLHIACYILMENLYIWYLPHANTFFLFCVSGVSMYAMAGICYCLIWGVSDDQPLFIYFGLYPVTKLLIFPLRSLLFYIGDQIYSSFWLVTYRHTWFRWLGLLIDCKGSSSLGCFFYILFIILYVELIF